MDAITAKPKLTARQEEILGLITDAISRSGSPLKFARFYRKENHLSLA